VQHPIVSQCSPSHWANISVKEPYVPPFYSPFPPTFSSIKNDDKFHGPFVTQVWAKPFSIERAVLIWFLKLFLWFFPLPLATFLSFLPNPSLSHSYSMSAYPLSLPFSLLIKSFNRDDTLSIILNHCYARVQSGQWRILSHQDLWQFCIFLIHFILLCLFVFVWISSFQLSLYLFILFRSFDPWFLPFHFVE
jgi:hypothetical protein